MSKRVSVRILTYSGWKTVLGVPVKIGVIADLFVATNYPFSNAWNITHVPSGHCDETYEPSPSRAAKTFEEKIKKIGRKKYQAAVR